MEETDALVEDGGAVRPYMDSALRHNKKRYLTFFETAAFAGHVESRRAGKSPRWSLLCVEIFEDEVTKDYRREARKHVLQDSSVGCLVFFSDVSKDRD